MLDDYLSHEECDSLIKYYKENEERLSVKHGMIYPLKFKEGYHKFPDLVNRLNATAKLFGNNQINWMQIVKWPVGAFQLHHHDQSQPDITLSSILYLNDDYEGGYTRFFSNKDDTTGNNIIPQIGTICLMDQSIEHDVPKITNGIKYVIRTELMYK